MIHGNKEETHTAGGTAECCMSLKTVSDVLNNYILRVLIIHILASVPQRPKKCWYYHTLVHDIEYVRVQYWLYNTLSTVKAERYGGILSAHASHTKDIEGSHRDPSEDVLTMLLICSLSLLSIPSHCTTGHHGTTWDVPYSPTPYPPSDNFKADPTASNPAGWLDIPPDGFEARPTAC